MPTYLLAFPLLILIISPHFAQAEFTCTCGELCPTGWTQWNGHCYVKITSRTWHEAIRECHRLDSYMVVPHSQEETDFLLTMKLYFWINCIDIYKEGDWECCDGARTTYRNWNDGEPNNGGGNEDCATVQKTGKWNDIPCDYEAGTICKKPLKCLH